MSVIVRMDMPNRCYDCPICYDMMGCPITGNGLDWENYDKVKLEDCPLKSIDGLIEKITQLHTQENTEGQDMYQAYDVVKTIKEYCGEDNDTDGKNKGMYE